MKYGKYNVLVDVYVPDNAGYTQERDSTYKEPTMFVNYKTYQLLQYNKWHHTLMKVLKGPRHDEKM